VFIALGCCAAVVACVYRPRLLCCSSMCIAIDWAFVLSAHNYCAVVIANDCKNCDIILLDFCAAQQMLYILWRLLGACVCALRVFFMASRCFFKDII
jgi:hypothetical protein